MECYEGAPMIKTFRGLIVDGAEDTIVLHTNDGSTGYRIVKFRTIAAAPGSTDSVNVTKIYKVPQSSIVATIDFSDQTLLGVSINTGPTNFDFGLDEHVAFDQEIFNQDIYISQKDVKTGESINYYLELEQVKLDMGENTVATLKDIRNKELRTMIA